jgi:hypothetical protein
MGGGAAGAERGEDFVMEHAGLGTAEIARGARGAAGKQSKRRGGSEAANQPMFQHPQPLRVRFNPLVGLGVLATAPRS